jgi:hypothetical protein
VATQPNQPNNDARGREAAGAYNQKILPQHFAQKAIRTARQVGGGNRSAAIAYAKGRRENLPNETGHVF